MRTRLDREIVPIFHPQQLTISQRLLAKVYEIDPFVCPGRMGEQAAQRPTSPKGGSEMEVIAVIQETEEIRRILAHLVKIAGGRPAIAARLRSHFAQRTNTTIS